MSDAPRDETLEDINEFSRWSGLPKSWIYERTARGEIPHLKLGKYLRFTRESRAWVGQHRRGPEAK